MLDDDARVRIGEDDTEDGAGSAVGERSEGTYAVGVCEEGRLGGVGTILGRESGASRSEGARGAQVKAPSPAVRSGIGARALPYREELFCCYCMLMLYISIVECHITRDIIMRSNRR
mmetsp:Transcript_5149/g.14821  ORF Transcript_5149/g.14821 Transcript_5149/m.14821 type:complete len:117 (-) Transcript_5149:3-353(-)